MTIKFHGKFLYFVWDSSVPDFAWKLARFPRFRIACYGQYENALEVRIF